MFQPQLVIGLFIGLQFIVAIKMVSARPVYTLDPSYVDSLKYSRPDYSMDEILSKIYDQKNWNSTVINPEEYGNYFDGDMVKPEPKPGVLSDFVEYKPNIWPNAVVTYEFSRDYSSKQKNLIHIAMSRFTAMTCVRFRERTVEKDYVFFDAQNLGCFSSVGRVGGRQVLNLHIPYCFLKIGTIMHEIMHALGFLHEQSRNDRDQYLKIIWDNIDRSKLHNFDKSLRNITKRLDFEYDFGSVMHYSEFAFAIDDTKPTLVPLRHVTTAATAMGQRIGFSPTDIDELRAKYECKKVDHARDRDDPEESIYFHFTSGNISLSLDYEDNIIDYR